MINANNNISHSSDRISNLTDSSQSKSNESNSFAVKMDKILKKYKKTNDEIIRNQREAKLRTDKAAVEEETSEAARIAMAFICGDSSQSEFSTSDSATATEGLTFDEISKSLMNDISQLNITDTGDLLEEKSADEASDTAQASTDTVASVSGLGMVTSPIPSMITETVDSSAAPTDILEKIARFFGQGTDLQDDAKKAQTESETLETQPVSDAVTDKSQSSGGIKLKDLERILNDTRFGGFGVSSEKTEKTTADVGTGRQLPNVTFKTYGPQETVETAKLTEAGSESGLAETKAKVAETVPADPNQTNAKSQSTAEASKKESTIAEGANISTSKVNSGNSENNNLQFSAGNGENQESVAEQKLNSKKLSTIDSVAQQQVLQQKSDSITENIQKTQELKNVEVNEFATKVFDSIRNSESNSTNHLTMTLTPDSLGTLIVEVAVEGDAARISIKAETQDAAKAIEEQMPLLKEKLEAQGLKLEQAEVSHYSRNDSAGQSFARDKERREEYQLRQEFIRTSGRGEEDLHEEQD